MFVFSFSVNFETMLAMYSFLVSMVQHYSVVFSCLTTLVVAVFFHFWCRSFILFFSILCCCMVAKCWAYDALFVVEVVLVSTVLWDDLVLLCLFMVMI
jgi:hypothetical protein